MGRRFNKKGAEIKNSFLNRGNLQKRAKNALSHFHFWKYDPERSESIFQFWKYDFEASEPIFQFWKYDFEASESTFHFWKYDFERSESIFQFWKYDFEGSEPIFQFWKSKSTKFEAFAQIRTLTGVTDANESLIYLPGANK